MSKSQRKTLSQEKVPGIVQALLETPFWLPTLTTMNTYARLHDDHDGTKEGVLNVVFSPDGDAHVWIAGIDGRVSQSLRFRNYGGGGVSLRTRNALLVLAEAMRLDSEEYPTL